VKSRLAVSSSLFLHFILNCMTLSFFIFPIFWGFRRLLFLIPCTASNAGFAGPAMSLFYSAYTPYATENTPSFSSIFVFLPFIFAFILLGF
jgi:hypothetical protein